MRRAVEDVVVLGSDQPKQCSTMVSFTRNVTKRSKWPSTHLSLAHSGEGTRQRSSFLEGTEVDDGTLHARMGVET